MMPGVYATFFIIICEGVFSLLPAHFAEEANIWKQNRILGCEYLGEWQMRQERGAASKHEQEEG